MKKGQSHRQGDSIKNIARNTSPRNDILAFFPFVAAILIVPPVEQIVMLIKVSEIVPAAATAAAAYQYGSNVFWPRITQ